MESSFRNSLQEVLAQMENHFEATKYSSYDLCDVKAFPLVLKYYNHFYKKAFSKYFLFPVELIINRFSGIIRSITGIKKHAYAQSHALIIRGNLYLYRQSGNMLFLKKSSEMLDWVMNQNSVETKYLSWGQPYDWFSKDIIPAYTPRTTVSSQMLHTLCDMYLASKEDEHLKSAQELSLFFMNEMVRSVNTEDEICFSYTLVDKYKVHNANMMAASALYRSGTLLKDTEILSVARKCLNYTMRRQNRDGSWYYYELEDEKPSKIDNYHTGYVLEALSVIKELQGGDFDFQKEFDAGVDFFLNNFFIDEKKPKMTPSSVFPIDIQSCAQSILTLIELSKHRKELFEQAEKVLRFTLDNFYSSKGWFYYRINKRGRTQKISYIRWGDAWMYLAIVRYLTYTRHA